MKVVIYTLGTFGDFMPAVLIAEHLMRHGAEVLLLGNARFQSQAQRRGVAFEAVSDEARYREAYGSELSQGSPLAALSHTVDYHVPAIATAYEAVRGSHDQSPVDLILCVGFLYSGAVMAARELGIPCVPMVTSPRAMRHSRDLGDWEGIPGWGYLARTQASFRRSWRSVITYFKLVEPHINPVRRSLGLPGWTLRQAPRLSDFELCLALYPEWLLPSRTACTSNVRHCGFVFGSYTEKEPLSLEEGFQAPIVFTMGSTHLGREGLVELAESVCFAVNRPGIVIVDGDAWDPRYRHSHVRLSPPVDLDRLLAKATLVVHHGGMGTCAQALNAGVPQVIQPLVFDQFENARRFDELGVAVAMPQEAVNALSLSRVCEIMLEDERMAATIRACQQRISVAASLENVWLQLGAVLERRRTGCSRQACLEPVMESRPGKLRADPAGGSSHQTASA